MTASAGSPVGANPQTKSGNGLPKWTMDFFSLARDAGERWSSDACYRLGASLAYYALFSVFPLLLLAITAIGFVLDGDDTVRVKLVNSVATPSPEFRALVDQTLQSMQAHRTARGVGAIVGGIALLLGASGVFSELEASLNFIWRVKSTSVKGLWATFFAALRSKALSFAVVIAAAVALLVSLAVSTALGAVGAATASATLGRVIWPLAEALVALALLTLLFAAIYCIVPQTPVKWRDVFWAALLTSILFTVLKWVLAWYLVHLGGFAAYGAVGGVLGLLTWIYVASLVLFYGAEFSHVYAMRFGSLAGRPRDDHP
jgi:membrane protein